MPESVDSLIKTLLCWVLRDHARVSPAAVASATVHMVGVGCPLFVWVPEEGDRFRKEVSWSKARPVGIVGSKYVCDLHVIDVASVANSDGLLHSISWQGNL